MDQEQQGVINNSQMFEALFQYATIGIVFTNKNGEIIDANKFALDQFGYAITELKNQKIELLIPTEYHDKHETYRKNFYANPHRRPMGAGRDLFGQKKDGTKFPVEISLSNYQINGEIFVIAFVIDISIRKQGEQMVADQKSELEKRNQEIEKLNTDLEKKVDDRTKMLKETLHELEKSKEELKDALEKEKELGELKSRFVTMASHEFRTPLGTILSSASLISRYTLSEEQDKRDKHIKRIKESVDSMRSILEDFLSLGKLEEGSLSAKPERRNVEECIHAIQELIDDLQLQMKTGQEIKFEHHCEGYLDMDMNLFKNIITNLVSNAIKFSGETGRILVQISLEENELILSIKDNGIGISEEDLEHLFQRFFRAKNAVNIQGTGLGLHIVSRYIDLLNGNISVKSELGNGTEFEIIIPRYSMSS